MFRNDISRQAFVETCSGAIRRFIDQNPPDRCRDIICKYKEVQSTCVVVSHFAVVHPFPNETHSWTPFPFIC